MHDTSTWNRSPSVSDFPGWTARSERKGTFQGNTDFNYAYTTLDRWFRKLDTK